MRPDDPKGVMKHADRFYSGKALVILGGPSGEDWRKVRDSINPDVIISTNGATRIPGAEYWLLTENMNYCDSKAPTDQRLAGFMHVLDSKNTANHLMISHRTWNLLNKYNISAEKSTAIRRNYYRFEVGLSLRDYGLGFMAGPISQAPWKHRTKVRLGTVGMQTLHLAGILGCSEVHTIGFDLMFKEGQHHWYRHPKYEPARFRKPEMFVQFNGYDTQAWWVETALYLSRMEHVFRRDGLKWIDHSDGLLGAVGAWCAQ